MKLSDDELQEIINCPEECGSAAVCMAEELLELRQKLADIDKQRKMMIEGNKPLIEHKHEPGVF